MALLTTYPKSPESLLQELEFYIALGSPLEAIQGYASEEVGRVYKRAYELCQVVDQEPQLLSTLWLLASYFFAQGEFNRSIRMTQQLLDLAEEIQDPVQIALSRWGLGAGFPFYR